MKIFTSQSGDIYLGNVKDGLQKTIQILKPSLLVIIADDNTVRHCVPLIEPMTQAGMRIVIASGDQHKSLDSCKTIWSSLVQSGADRESLILNVGGGMICDLGGFAAACFQRGIRFVHIPTSLLAMADAAIGGKTSINFEGYKNYIGRFETPAFIWTDPAFLKSLPEQEILDGLAEIVKHAIIGSKDLWETISTFDELTTIDWYTLLERNIPIKQNISETDPLEKGIRKTLNFGHTIGHALESHFLHSLRPLSHGQAVTLGMLAETKLANLSGLLGNEDFKGIIELIQRLLRPCEVTLPSMDALKPWLLGDKKKTGGSVGYSLPDGIGSCRWDIKLEEKQVWESLDWVNQVRKR
ncbi:MAG: 3-dehydroquinate synthase family protein [Saprospiraceae bacterium]|nr:3-dehydroquinate synthase family protein [Saprospiraceae bacterium]